MHHWHFSSLQERKQGKNNLRLLWKQKCRQNERHVSCSFGFVLFFLFHYLSSPFAIKEHIKYKKLRSTSCLGCSKNYWNLKDRGEENFRNQHSVCLPFASSTLINTFSISNISWQILPQCSMQWIISFNIFRSLDDTRSRSFLKKKKKKSYVTRFSSLFASQFNAEPVKKLQSLHFRIHYI